MQSALSRPADDYVVNWTRADYTDALRCMVTWLHHELPLAIRRGVNSGSPYPFDLFLEFPSHGCIFAKSQTFGMLFFFLPHLDNVFLDISVNSHYYLKTSTFCIISFCSNQSHINWLAQTLVFTLSFCEKFRPVLLIKLIPVETVISLTRKILKLLLEQRKLFASWLRLHADRKRHLDFRTLPLPLTRKILI